MPQGLRAAGRHAPQAGALSDTLAGAVCDRRRMRPMESLLASLSLSGKPFQRAYFLAAGLSVGGATMSASICTALRPLNAPGRP